MQRSGSLVGTLVLVMVAIGCAPPPPVDTRDADVKAVKDLEVAWSRDMAAKDLDKATSNWSDDAAILMPNEPIINGREKAKEVMKAMMADPNFALTFQTTKVEASKGGDIVYTVGTYSMTLSNPVDKKPVTDKGKYVTVYKKQADGSWKAVADMINSDLPLPGSAPPQ